MMAFKDELDQKVQQVSALEKENNELK